MIQFAIVTVNGRIWVVILFAFSISLCLFLFGVTFIEDYWFNYIFLILFMRFAPTVIEMPQIALH